MRIAVLLLVVTGLTQAEKLIIGSNNQKKKRSFSIFSIVNFPNTQCTTLSTANTNLVMFGTCVSSDACTSSKGFVDGNCASGFGVCCMFSVSECGSTITRNISYIQNPGFPSSFSNTGPCTYNFQAGSDICQIRLDYNVLQVANPDTVTTVGSCTSVTAIDNVIVTSPSGANPPIICGLNSGQHIYFETEKQTSSGNLVFNIGTTGGIQTRTWKVKVSFIECISPFKAPADCLQYLTGPTGKFQSFNFQSARPQTLASLNYNICIRQEEGFCSNSYSVDTSVTGNPFFISTSLATKRSCVAPSLSYITIVSPVNLYTPGTIVITNGVATLAPSNYLSNLDTYCGTYLNSISGSTVNGVVIGAPVAPFFVGVFATNGGQAPGAPGFSLMFMQVAC